VRERRRAAQVAHIASLEDDEAFVAACRELGAEYGLDVGPIEHGRLAVGGGFRLLLEPSRGAQWVFLDASEAERRFDKGSFSTFFLRGESLAAAPRERADFDASVLFIAHEELACFYALETGMLRRVQL